MNKTDIKLKSSSKMHDGLGVRHIQLTLLFLCMATIYVSRVNLSMAIVGMTDLLADNETRDDVYMPPVFHWEEEIKGTILSSFFWGYLVMNVPASIITYKFNNKILLTAVMLSNSALCLLTPVIVIKFDYISLIVIRVMQGLLQGFIMPTIHNLLSRWVPPTERARAGAFVIGGLNFGIALIMYTSGFMINSTIGWPLVFYISGLLNVVWVLLWLSLGANSPDSHKSISATEHDYIKSTLTHTAHEKTKMPIPWKSILTSKSVWAIVFAHMGQNWGMWTLLTEIPTFFNSALDFDIASDGELSSIPYFLLWIASFPLSYLADRLIRKNYMSVEFSRKFWNNIGQTVSGLILISLPYIGQYVSHEMAIFTYSITTMLNSCILFGFNINHLDISPNFSCVLMGISNGAANITSILAPLFAGFMVEDETNINDWRIVFFMSSCLYIAGSIIFTIFGSGTVQKWNGPPNQQNQTDLTEDNIEANH
ncbi:putative inorganic phosphate cotransporter isoform X2 [Lycorma delicatula]|uniref:putative inorganic phosphate cotransporter isoform X2 n=1 Tax=Lycorma delicatula TaxID=130591 RepID=UPI003F513DA1